jgi:sugar lactone lactonase YvrE
MRRKPLLLLTATVASLVLSPAIRLDSPFRSQVRKGDIPAPFKQKKYVNAQESARVAEAFRKANNAFNKEDYKAGAETLLTAYAINPEDDFIINMIAEAYAMVGDRAALLMWLRRLLKVSPCFFHFPETAASVLSLKEYRNLALAAKAKQTRRHESEIAFMLSETDLIPEGIAYDPLDKVFFLSSLHKRKIISVRVQTRQRPPIVEDFTAERQDGLYSTLGMKVDAARRILWVCSSAESFMKGYSESDADKAALFKYDLNTRKLIRKYELGPNPRHLLNDLVLNAEGDAFVTDTASGEIFTVRHDKDELEVFIPAGRFVSPNGIAISKDGRMLFISDLPFGVYAVDVKTKQSERLPQRVGISPSGSDGLYFYDNSLIGIINIVSERNGRVARFYLDASTKALTHAAVLDCNHPLYRWPTTGVVVGNSFFYIANSQFGTFDSEQRAFSQKDLRKVVVMRLRL